MMIYLSKHKHTAKCHYYYVVHQVVLLAAVHVLVQRVFEPHAPDAGSLALQLAIWALTIGGSLLVALASWRFVERPILAQKRRFPYRREPRDQSLSRRDGL